MATLVLCLQRDDTSNGTELAIVVVILSFDKSTAERRMNIGHTII